MDFARINLVTQRHHDERIKYHGKVYGGYLLCATLPKLSILKV